MSGVYAGYGVTQLARSLSWGRRRRPPAEKSSNEMHMPERVTTEGDTESTSTENDAAATSPWMLQPLSSPLNKRHASSAGGMSGRYAKRWFEVDDHLGCLYQFKTRTDQERRSTRPHELQTRTAAPPRSDGPRPT